MGDRGNEEIRERETERERGSDKFGFCFDFYYQLNCQFASSESLSPAMYVQSFYFTLHVTGSLNGHIIS